MNPQTPISSLPGIGQYYFFKLKKIGIETVQDLLYHIPTRYQDFSLITPIATIQSGEKVTIKGQILSIKNIYTRTRKQIQQALVSDGQEELTVTWFNQPYLAKTLIPGTQVSLSGRVEATGRKKTMVAPEWEKIRDGEVTNAPNTLHTGRLVPIYPETEGLSSKWLRGKIAQILPPTIQETEDFLPENILEKYSLLPLPQAIQKAHFPENYQEAQEARKRVAFNELFGLQLKSLIRKKQWNEKKTAPMFVIDKKRVEQFMQALPFELTDSQKKAAKEVLEDVTHEVPMNRLLEGDVGSGKTVIAALACFIAHTNGYQSAIMAPTQILVSQHYKTLVTLLKPLGLQVELVTSENKRTKTQDDALDRKSQTNIYVGTHALVQKHASFYKLGLVVIDEQHRFGVRQRAILSEKAQDPHVLTMTATPIPRTVALAAYGDLSLSTLDELPKGRTPVKTWVVPPQKREGAYDWIRKRVKDTDEQAFIVCPLINESDKEGMKSIKAATVEFEKLSTKIFPDLKLALLHGKVKGKEKDAIMEKMKRGEVDILVATPIVEVGIDISNATIMMIEASERFGLAQLHQLRGRVGRGNKQSYCLLFAEGSAPQAVKRLKSLEKTLSGRKLAEIDLEMRGPGEMYGTAQHGYPELKVASFTDYDLIKIAREAAQELLGQKTLHPILQKVAETITSVAPN